MSPLPFNRPIALVGKLTFQEAEALLLWAEQGEIPLFVDPCSQLRNVKHPLIFPIKQSLMAATSCDAVLWFGGRLLSPGAETLLAEAKSKGDAIPLWRIQSVDRIEDPSALATHRILCPLPQFFKEHASRFHTSIPKPWVYPIQVEWSEAQIVQTLSQYLTEEDALFCANSMPIRLWDSLSFQNLNRPIPFLANRGASGIDGNIATATGFSLALKRKTYALLGDLAMWHDVAALQLLKRSGADLRLILLNNSGGGIFKTLAVAQNNPFFERFFYAQHDLNFADAATWANLSYKTATHQSEFLNALKSNTSVIECYIPIQ